MTVSREALIQLLGERSVRFGDFVLASGAHSPYYIDCRLTTMSARGQRLVGALGLAAIREAGWQVQAVGGLTMGADPVAYAIASASADNSTPIDAFSVRKAAKEHGTGRQIEGNFAPGDRVVVVEDVITSGASALTAIEVIQAAGGIVVGVFAVVDREAGGRERIAATGIPVRSLVSARELGCGNDGAGRER
ncbi:MAG: orotate phosphoribosyltransferase [Gemmatimonadales bacterium]|nr:orotate phosphoribosyltransferase [Gemmatimonadales bacterium]